MTNLPKWIDDVLHFWFEEVQPEARFVRSDALDATIRKRFVALHASLTEKVPATVTTTPAGALAAVIVLDQFSRNLYRNSPRAFASDTTALAIAQEAIDRGFDRELTRDHRMFLYMPFQHSEDRAVQRRSLELFASLELPQVLKYAQDHHDIVARFGRFPHRNRVLNRDSSNEEAEFLKTHPGF